MCTYCTCHRCYPARLWVCTRTRNHSTTDVWRVPLQCTYVLSLSVCPSLSLSLSAFISFLTFPFILILIEWLYRQLDALHLRKYIRSGRSISLHFIGATAALRWTWRRKLSLKASTRIHFNWQNESNLSENNQIFTICRHHIWIRLKTSVVDCTM